MSGRPEKYTSMINELMRISPNHVEKKELCCRLNILPKELPHLLKAHKEQLRGVIIKKVDNNGEEIVFFSISVKYIQHAKD